MTALEVWRSASEAGMVFKVDGTKLRLHGGSKEQRAELAPLIAPHAQTIARLIRPCVPGACAECGYIHGTLEPRPPCDGCGSTDRTAMLVIDDGTRYCSGCLAGRRPAAGRGHHAS